MNEVTNVNDAMHFFLSNSSGSLTVKAANGQWKECDCFQEAKDFLLQNGEIK